MVKLESGREISTEEVSWTDIATFEDYAQEYVKRGVSLSVKAAGELIYAAKAISNLNELKRWSTADIMEAAMKIYADNKLDPPEKKS